MHPAQSSGQRGKGTANAGLWTRGHRKDQGANEKWEGDLVSVKPYECRLHYSVRCYFIDGNKASVFLMANSIEMALFGLNLAYIFSSNYQLVGFE